jgi:hypothetical protein
MPVEAPALRPRDEQTRFQHRLGQFLDEERHSVGLGDNLRRHFERQIKFMPGSLGVLTSKSATDKQL